jgi:hypothetical protein
VVCTDPAAEPLLLYSNRHCRMTTIVAALGSVVVLDTAVELDTVVAPDTAVGSDTVVAPDMAVELDNVVAPDAGVALGTAGHCTERTVDQTARMYLVGTRFQNKQMPQVVSKLGYRYYIPNFGQRVIWCY